MDPEDRIADLEEEVRFLRSRVVELEEQLHRALERKVEEVSVFTLHPIVTDAMVRLFGVRRQMRGFHQKSKAARTGPRKKRRPEVLVSVS